MQPVAVVLATAVAARVLVLATVLPVLAVLVLLVAVVALPSTVVNTAAFAAGVAALRGSRTDIVGCVAIINSRRETCARDVMYKKGKGREAAASGYPSPVYSSYHSWSSIMGVPWIGRDVCAGGSSSVDPEAEAGWHVRRRYNESKPLILSSANGYFLAVGGQKAAHANSSGCTRCALFLWGALFR